MKKIQTIVLLVLLVPGCVFACSAGGFTVVYVNGVFTTEDQATADMHSLQNLIGSTTLGQSVAFVTGYNPVHLDGLGDVLESISQAFNTPISGYDLETILAQIAAQALTRKLLLIGHSQGSFYTNEMYDYLIKSGVPPAAVAVYNIATPASVVAGNGGYLTSSNDKVINYVRGLDAQWGAPMALPANTTVPKELGYASSTWGGHIPSVYFNGAGERITSDIKAALAQLTETDPPSGNCITPPSPGFLYGLENIAFGLGDPLAAGIDQVATSAGAAAASAFNNTNNALNAAVRDAIVSVLPRPTAQNAAGVFAVEKALYGSSLSVADYEALLKGEDIPEVQPIPARTPDQTQNEVPAPTRTPTEQATSTETTTSETKGMSAVPATSTIPTSNLIPIMPGFGGGGSAPVQVSVVPTATSDTIASATSTPEDSSASTTTSTTTAPVAAVPMSATSTPTSTTPVVALAATGTSPVTDTFDQGFFGWNSYPVGWSTASWSTSTSDCYSGSCLSETGLNQLYENVKTGTPLSSGAFVIYFRNHDFNGQFDVGVCTDLTPTACENSASIGGLNALFFHLVGTYQDDAWHYFYFAFQDGSESKEYCVLVDDTEQSDCAWIVSTAPNGTTYSGIFFSTDDGLKDGQAFYWDELGTSTTLAGRGVQ